LPSGLPERLIGPFRRTVHRGQLISGIVTEPFGASALWREVGSWEDVQHLDSAEYEEFLRPQAIVRWGDAPPGELGWCVVTPPRRVTLSGTLTGLPADFSGGEANFGYCASARVPVSKTGAFRIEMWSVGECELRVNDGEGAAHVLVVDTTVDQSGLELAWHPRLTRDREQEIADAEEVLAVLESRSDGVSPYVAALADGLAPDVRAVLEAWRDEDRVLLAGMIQGWQDLLDRMIEAPPPRDLDEWLSGYTLAPLKPPARWRVRRRAAAREKAPRG
jgi:hypothetical protein